MNKTFEKIDNFFDRLSSIIVIVIIIIAGAIIHYRSQIDIIKTAVREVQNEK